MYAIANEASHQCFGHLSQALVQRPLQQPVPSDSLTPTVAVRRQPLTIVNFAHRLHLLGSYNSQNKRFEAGTECFIILYAPRASKVNNEN